MNQENNLENIYQEIFDVKKILLSFENSFSQESRLMDFNETCSYLKLKPGMLRKLIFENKIPVKRINRNIRFQKEEIREWLKNK